MFYIGSNTVLQWLQFVFYTFELYGYWYFDCSGFVEYTMCCTDCCLYFSFSCRMIIFSHLCRSLLQLFANFMSMLRSLQLCVGVPYMCSQFQRKTFIYRKLKVLPLIFKWEKHDIADNSVCNPNCIVLYLIWVFY